MTTPAQPSIFSRGLPEIYESVLVGPLFRPFAEVLIDRVSLRPGDRVLDIACGTGIVARLARERVGDFGRVVGLDASGPMLAVASRVAPDIEWHEANAAAMPFGQGDTFDVVFCHQGIQFVPDKKAAAVEMRRVLAPGGRVAVGVWRSIEDIPYMRELDRAAERHLGHFVDQRHSFGDPGALQSLLAEAGFTDIRVETVTLQVRIADGATFPRLNAMAQVGMSPAGRTMSEEERAKIVDAIGNDGLAATRSYLNGPDVVFDLLSNVATARA